MNKKLIIVLVIIFGVLSCDNYLYGQDELKNQISLNADDLIPALFSSSVTEYNLSYRRMVSQNKHLRFGLKYFYENDNQLTLGFRPGIDFSIKNQSSRWKFFYGLDIEFSYLDNYQGERRNYVYSAIPFFRIEFAFGKHFSISTEPGLFIKLDKTEDYDLSPIDSSNEIFSSGIKNLGVINLNFSF